MTTYNMRTNNEQQLIYKAYEFEREAILNLSSESNPYYEAILALEDGEALWDAIDEAIAMFVNDPE